MSRTSNELAHLFRALKAPAAARALPKLADRARAEEWSFERFAEAPRSTAATATAAKPASSRRASRRARRFAPVKSDPPLVVGRGRRGGEPVRRAKLSTGLHSGYATQGEFSMEVHLPLMPSAMPRWAAAGTLGRQAAGRRPRR